MDAKLLNNALLQHMQHKEGPFTCACRSSYQDWYFLFGNLFVLNFLVLFMAQGSPSGVT